MKCLVFFTLLIVCTGCTTLRPIEGSPTELRQRLDSGELLKTGDRVVIVTADAKAHRFAVKSIDAELIRGRSESVPIEQVVAVKRRNSPRIQRDARVVGKARLRCARLVSDAIGSPRSINYFLARL
jgi:hypothetical protein